MSLLPKKDDGTVDVKSMWEVKLLRGIALFFIYILFAMYVLAAVPSAWNWAQLKWYTQDFKIETLAETVPEFIDKDKERLAMTLISLYPIERTDEIAKILAPSSVHLDARYFFSISNNYYQLGNMEEARFWHTLGRFRLRYDAVRCDYELADQMADSFIEFVADPELMDDLQSNPGDLNKRLTRVLEWDDKYPPQNDPGYFCNYIRRVKGLSRLEILDEDLWPDMHTLLRMNAEDFLRESETGEEPSAEEAEGSE
ncbi:MAG: hypothetical protein ACQEQL_02190 [Pseudomonadota bacterium]